jgi:hypothetical protein
MKPTGTILALAVMLSALAPAADPPTETAAGWVKYAQNPVLGGDLGTCFDISVLKDADTYRMCFS